MIALRFALGGESDNGVIPARRYLSPVTVSNHDSWDCDVGVLFGFVQFHVGEMVSFVFEVDDDYTLRTGVLHETYFLRKIADAARDDGYSSLNSLQIGCNGELTTGVV